MRGHVSTVRVYDICTETWIFPLFPQNMRKNLSCSRANWLCKRWGLKVWMTREGKKERYLFNSLSYTCVACSLSQAAFDKKHSYDDARAGLDTPLPPPFFHPPFPRLSLSSPNNHPHSSSWTDMVPIRPGTRLGFWGGAQTRIIYKSCSSAETVVIFFSFKGLKGMLWRTQNILGPIVSPSVSLNFFCCSLGLFFTKAGKTHHTRTVKQSRAYNYKYFITTVNLLRGFRLHFFGSSFGGIWWVWQGLSGHLWATVVEPQKSFWPFVTKQNVLQTLRLLGKTPEPAWINALAGDGKRGMVVGCTQGRSRGCDPAHAMFHMLRIASHSWMSQYTQIL